jgi:dimethylargininase
MQIAITREVSPAIARCELTYQQRVEIDYQLACRQHAAYCQALAGLGCQVVSLPAEPELPDSVFVEDAALVLDELAILTHPGAPSRRPEVDCIRPVLADYRRVESIRPPATLDGGDILRMGRSIYVGQSSRSSQPAIEQLAVLTAPHGYSVQAVALTGCLHLKSAVTEVAPGVVLLNPAWVDARVFSAYRCLEVHPSEPHAANALLLAQGLVYPTCFPRTLERLERAGLQVTTVDVSEMQKAEGAVTCCSLILNSMDQI